MSKKLSRRLLALSVGLILLLSACTSGEKTPDAPSSDSSTLTRTNWNGFDSFLKLAGRTYPEIKWEYTAYAGANRTGYSWAQTRSGEGALSAFVRAWLEEQGTVSPDGNPWE